MSGTYRPREPRQMVHTETLVIEMRAAGGRAQPGQSRNISLSGIFVEMPEPPPAGTEVQLFVGASRNATALRAMGRVVHSMPGVGFGARFLDQSAEAYEHVGKFIQLLRDDQPESREPIRSLVKELPDWLDRPETD